MNQYEPMSGTPVNAGKYRAEISVANGQATAYVEYEITKKDVTIKAHDLSKHIGKADPDFAGEYDVAGLVTGERIYGVQLKREEGEGAGTYATNVTISPNEAKYNSNYNVTLVNGKFTIEDHKWKEEVVRPATEVEEGLRKKTCTYKKGEDKCNTERYETISTKGNEASDTYKDKIEKYVLVSDPEIERATLNNTKTQLVNKSKIFDQNEKNKINSGDATANVWLEIKFHTYQDAQGQKQIAEPGIPISIRFKVPDNMVNRQPYMIRDYKIIRLHEDESGNVAVDVLNADFNSSTREVTFETDKLSVFALTYKDTSYSPSYPVTGIKVSPESITLTKKGETAQLTAEVTPFYADNKTVTWKSGDEKVATVDENGRVTAIGNGTATITVAAGDGKSTASVTITVKVPKNNKRLATLTSGRTQTWTQKELKKGTFYQYVVKAYKMVDGQKVVTDVSTSVHTVTQGGAYEIAQPVSVTRIGNQKNTLEITMAKG